VVELASQQRTRLPIRLRRIILCREDGRLLTLLTNDLRRSAGQIAALYRQRWQIELLFAGSSSISRSVPSSAAPKTLSACRSSPR
jgi:IS4 transposase